MSWKNTLTFLDSPSGITHKVRGQEITFYQMSPRMLLQLRGISQPLSQALSILLRSKKSDSEAVFRDFNDPTTGEKGTETVQRAVPLETMEMLLNKKERAIDKLVDTFSEDANLILLAKIIFDSCRDTFPRTPTPEDLSEFLDTEGVDTGVIVQFLIGVGKANIKTMGPLADRVSEAFSTKLEEALETPKNQNEETPTQSPPESQSEAPASPFQTPG